MQWTLAGLGYYDMRWFELDWTIPNVKVNEGTATHSRSIWRLQLLERETKGFISSDLCLPDNTDLDPVGHRFFSANTANLRHWSSLNATNTDKWQATSCKLTCSIFSLHYLFSGPTFSVDRLIRIQRLIKVFVLVVYIHEQCLSAVEWVDCLDVLQPATVRSLYRRCTAHDTTVQDSQLSPLTVGDWPLSALSGESVLCLVWYIQANHT